MSHPTPTRPRGQRHADAPDAPNADTPSPDAPETPTPDAPLTDEQKAAAKVAAEKAEADKIAAISGAEVAPTPDGDLTFITATTPVRARSAVQEAMDAVAAKAYADWVAADRPVLWQKMPVITYFLDPAELPEYRKLIRRAAQAVTPDGESTGVRIRFGKDFVLTEKMATKIGKPDAAGKTVLAWAAIDKRKNSANGDASTNATTNATTNASE